MIGTKWCELAVVVVGFSLIRNADAAGAMDNAEGPRFAIVAGHTCLTEAACDAQRRRKGFPNIHYYVGDHVGLYGCFSKNDRAYWGRGGAPWQQAIDPLGGVKERIWCEGAGERASVPAGPASGLRGPTAGTGTGEDWLDDLTDGLEDADAAGEPGECPRENTADHVFPRWHPLIPRRPKHASSSFRSLHPGHASWGSERAAPSQPNRSLCRETHREQRLLPCGRLRVPRRERGVEGPGQQLRLPSVRGLESW